MREVKAPARSCVHAGSSEPSPHADVIGTIIWCADQSIIYFFSADHYSIFLFSIIISKVKNFETVSERSYLE